MGSIKQEELRLQGLKELSEEDQQAAIDLDREEREQMEEADIEAAIDSAIEDDAIAALEEADIEAAIDSAIEDDAIAAFEDHPE